MNKQILTALQALEGRERCLIAIDGCCASGKTTLAASLADQLGCPVLHMDDYVIPHREKTPERLALPGGNADVERFNREVTRPWLEGKALTCQAYSCREDRLLEPVTLPESRFLIVEGCYCLHPEIPLPWDLRLFLRISPEEQRRRILLRNGEEGLKRFLERWIPLEEAYFSAFRLPDEGCLAIRNEAESS